MLIAMEPSRRRMFLQQSGQAVLGAALSLTVLPAGAAAAAADLKKIITQYYADYAALDLEKVLSYYTEDCHFEDPTFHIVLRGRKEIRAAFTPLKPLYQRVRFEPTLLLVSGNWLICQHVQSGTMKRNAKAEFKDYQVQGVTLFEFAGDKIKRQYDYYDVATLRKQTGATNNPQ
jgi:ketosteroid isomerase-like protein